MGYQQQKCSKCSKNAERVKTKAVRFTMNDCNRDISVSNMIKERNVHIIELRCNVEKQSCCTPFYHERPSCKVI